MRYFRGVKTSTLIPLAIVTALGFVAPYTKAAPAVGVGVGIGAANSTSNAGAVAGSTSNASSDANSSSGANAGSSSGANSNSGGNTQGTSTSINETTYIPAPLPRQTAGVCPEHFVPLFNIITGQVQSCVPIPRDRW